MTGRRGARARGGGARGGKANNGAKDRIAKPSVKELPADLQFVPTNQPIPPAIMESFQEFSKSQPFFSGLEKLMPELVNSNDGYTHCWSGIQSNSINSIDREENTFLAKLNCNDSSSTPVFVKRIHLLEPVRAMEGEYIWPEDGSLPAPSEVWKNALSKINDPMNEAYVDCLFALYASKLVEGGYSPGWCRCYGTFSARVEKYIYDISDEYSSMRNKPWWRRNQKLGIFSLYKDDEDSSDKNHNLISDLVDLEMGDFIDIAEENDFDKANEEETVNVSVEEQDMEDSIDHESTPVKLSTPKLRLKRLNNTNASESASASCESEYQRFVEFRNFPVQVTLLERAEGTLDSLIDDEDETMLQTKESRWSAWLFQIIAALTVAQYWFGFVHNDLHTNNVMWSSTDQPYLYFRIRKNDEIVYKKVPTFGRIMKIIDFGRASFHLPDPAGFIISDAFYPGNDAGNQYNCDPFFDSEEGKKIEPNPSFDLCRLAVSLLDSLYSERPDTKKPIVVMSREDGGKKLYTETVSQVYNLLWGWLQDDAGKNVLRDSNGDERYPDFDLYRAIAADVHKAVPKQQIGQPLFDEYNCTEVPEGAPMYDLIL